MDHVKLPDKVCQVDEDDADVGVVIKKGADADEMSMLQVDLLFEAGGKKFQCSQSP